MEGERESKNNKWMLRNGCKNYDFNTWLFQYVIFRMKIRRLMDETGSDDTKDEKNDENAGGVTLTLKVKMT